MAPARIPTGYPSRLLLLLTVALANVGGEGYTTIEDNPFDSADLGPKIMQWCGAKARSGEDSLRIIPEGVSEEKRNFSVTLKSGLVHCQNFSEFTVEIHRPPQNISFTYESGFSAEGYFRVGFMYYPPESFCISDWNSSIITVKVCGNFSPIQSNETGEWSHPDCGINKNITCIPKCCALNQVFTLNFGQNKIGKCQDPSRNSERFSTVLYSSPFQKVQSQSPVHYMINRVQRNRDHPQFLVHESSQISSVFTNAISLCFHIRQDGALLYHDLKSSWVEVSREDYCVNGFQLNGPPMQRPPNSFLEGERNLGVFVRMKAESHETAVKKTQYAVMYGSVFFVASVFLLITFVVHVLLWKEQKIHGWTTMSHTITMFFLYFFRGANYFFELRARDIGRAYRSNACMASGILTHYFFLSNFCWLTVVCFSLYWTFRGVNVGSPHSRDANQYCLYAAFGWGLPFLFVTIAVILDQKYSYEPCNMIPVPEYGIGTCSVSIGALGPYKYYPVAFLVLLNLIFFSMTFYKLSEYKKSASGASKVFKGNRKLFKVITKLFFVMGFTWTFELILWCWWWMIGGERKWFRAITNLTNCCLAVAIFIIYVCKSNVGNSLKNNYPGLRRFLNLISNKAETSATVQSTSLEGDRQMHIKIHQRKRDMYS